LARKILLADDSVTAQNMGRKILADAGYEVVTVNNGSAALKKIAELKPDLVILDVYMPGYSGLEVCQRMKEAHDSSRIPVLLTVGKLEPFKPEEAQRVRADAYIIKPFEASELLGALSKLEDKVVPRSEPSKPGRFARAIAAVEESGRVTKNDSTSEENGWKSRIAFPQAKKEEEKPQEDDSTIYNAMNRDLRTVVDAGAVKQAEQDQLAARQQKAAQQTPQPIHEEMRVEPSINVAALSPPGLSQEVPQDVTPEEVAAIAAAAAQIQRFQEVLKDEEARSERKTVEQNQPATAQPIPEAQVVTEVKPEAAQSSQPEIGHPVSAAPAIQEVAQPVAQEAAPQAAKDEVAQEEVAQEASRDRRMEDVPMTMAAATEATVNAGATPRRWAAVSVALGAEETNISLEQEMQRAYEAFVAQEAASAGTKIAEPQLVEQNFEAHVEAQKIEAPKIEEQKVEPQPPQPETNSVAVEHAIEPTPMAAIATPQPELAAIPQTQSEYVQPEPPDAVASVVPGQPIRASETPAAIAQPEMSSEAPVVAEAVGETATGAAPAEPQPEPVAPPQFAGPLASSQPISQDAGIAPEESATTATLESAIPQAKAPAPEITAPTNTFTSFISASENAAPSVAIKQQESRRQEIKQEESQPEIRREEPKADAPYALPHKGELHHDESEAVKTSAAAWANWRQIRDAAEPKAAPPQPPIDIPAVAEAAAMAVAAGAEHPAPEAQQPSENPADVASIVDSVLADLRPRLMAEIKRKMSEKK
jgi:twitching motility two-component system response regulator PilH